MIKALTKFSLNFLKFVRQRAEIEKISLFHVFPFYYFRVVTIKYRSVFSVDMKFVELKQ